MTKIPLKKDCFVTSLALMGIKKLGFESLEWEPELLRDAFEEEFNLDKLPQKSFDKLNCGYMLISTDAFTASLEGFLTATACMNNMVFDETEIPFCTFEHCAWSIWEYINLLGDIENGKPVDTFDDAIIVYLREAGKLNGITRFPVWMQFAEDTNQPVPDASEDVHLFEMYNLRQNEYISYLNQSVTLKQDKLLAELQELQKDKILA